MSDVAPEKQHVKAFRFLLGLLVYGVTIGIVVVALAFWWGANQFTTIGMEADEPQLFVVERGDGANTIAFKLHAKDIIHDPYIFMIGTTVLGNHTFLKAGEYEIQPGMSQRDVMQLMVDGDIVGRRVTIREGLTSFEVVRHLKGVEELKGEVDKIPVEGILYPNTYDYRLNEERQSVLIRMRNMMLEIVLTSCGYVKRAPDFNTFYDYPDEELMLAPCHAATKNPALKDIKTVNDVLTLASIIEKETSVAEERAKVAGVFINRLNRGIPLQTDPTVIYAITKGAHKNDGKGPLGRRLLRKDLQYDSPYNTYRYPGLPPGPIANPGKASIKAVLNPESHNYIYFVADGTGGHAFAKTLAEHNRNVAKWRKIRRAQKK
ncbi:MAG: endolytic transglycosylase MltG [Bdellovibrionales bacterium]